MSEMDDNEQLVNAIAGGIAREPKLADFEWAEATVVFTFAEDGFCSGHFGYAYDADGASFPFVVDDWQVEKDAEAYRARLREDGRDGIRQMLFQFNRDNGRFHADFHYGAKPRWQVTPENLDRIVPELRPGLGKG